METLRSLVEEVTMRCSAPAAVLVTLLLAVVSGCTVHRVVQNEQPSNTPPPAAEETADPNAPPADVDADGSKNKSTGTGTGSVPARLVGTWGSEGGGAIVVRTFNADGTYKELSSLTSSGGACTMKYVWDEAGVATFTADEMILDRQEGTLLTETCSAPAETKPTAPQSTTKSYKLEAGVLYVWNPAECADPSTCAQKFEKR